MGFSPACVRVAGGLWFVIAAPAAGAAWRSDAGASRVPGSSTTERTRGYRSLGLGPQRRLTQRADFERLLRVGKRRSMSGYTFYLEARESGPPRLGILVTRKHAGRATERNYLKRCIREAFRLEQAKLGSVNVLIRPPYGAKPGAAMLLRLRELLGGIEQ